AQGSCARAQREETRTRSTQSTLCCGSRLVTLASKSSILMYTASWEKHFLRLGSHSPTRTVDFRGVHSSACLWISAPAFIIYQVTPGQDSGGALQPEEKHTHQWKTISLLLLQMERNWFVPVVTWNRINTYLWYFC
ncbi:hypothetical protein LEMLEM_LOCUS21696, partial [Lemmus lemmus]